MFSQIIINCKTCFVFFQISTFLPQDDLGVRIKREEEMFVNGSSTESTLFFACTIHPSIHKTIFCLFVLYFLFFSLSLPFPDSSSAVNGRRESTIFFLLICLFPRFNKIMKKINNTKTARKKNLKDKKKKNIRKISLTNLPPWCFCLLDPFNC